MIDFNQDIAPLRQQYFPMLVGEQAFDQAMKYRQEVLMPMQMQTLKMQEQQMRMRQQDLSYKQQQFSLRQARKAARRENEAMERLPEVVDQLNSIIDRPDQNVFDQQRDIAKLQMQYQTTAQYSPLLNNLFKSASNSVSNRYKQQEEVSGMVYQAAVSGVPVDTIRQQAEADGTVTPREQIAIDISEAVQKKGIDQIKKAQDDLFREEEKERKQALIKRAEGDYSDVIKMSPVDVTEDLVFSFKNQNEAKAVKLEDMLAKATENLAFEANSRAQLERLYYDYASPEKQFILDKNPSALGKDSFSDSDLYRAVLRQTRSIIQSAFKKPEDSSAPSSISSLFTPK